MTQNFGHTLVAGTCPKLWTYTGRGCCWYMPQTLDIHWQGVLLVHAPNFGHTLAEGVGGTRLNTLDIHWQGVLLVHDPNFGHTLAEALLPIKAFCTPKAQNTSIPGKGTFQRHVYSTHLSPEILYRSAKLHHVTIRGPGCV